MELKFLHAYENIDQYNPDHQDSWEKCMIAPFWKQISQWAPFCVDYMKPKPIMDKLAAKQQLELFREIDFNQISLEFKKITSLLPIDDDDPMTVAFYPSETRIKEGIYGAAVWGNIILNINPMNENAVKWLPFVFAHEYHHIVLGCHWYCVKRGEETKGNLLEQLINEGEADNFAQSLYPAFFPSWHTGITEEREQDIWNEFKENLYTVAPAQQFSPYFYGDSSRGIPPSAGYYFGYCIVKSYMNKHPAVSYSELIQIPHQQIFDDSGFMNAVSPQ